MFFCNFCNNNNQEERKRSAFESSGEDDTPKINESVKEEPVVIVAPVTTPTKSVTYENLVFEEPTTPCDIGKIFEQASDDMNKLFEDAEAARINKENEWRKKREAKKLNSKKKKKMRNNQTPLKKKKQLAQQHLQKQRAPLSSVN